jgi:hypothetical protein
MEIQNNTDENVVYEAKDGGPGGGQDPLSVLCGNALLVHNSQGSAGRLGPSEKVDISAGVDSFGTVQLHVYRPADLGQPVAMKLNISPTGNISTIVEPVPDQFEIH